ncbi:hypothetical protein BCR39DRAFT_491169 [Naematelia encephala]|uniref:Vacuolar sorting protein Vps3844 C-terminal domain-containing protein n=1 Tax=Naematelia encephala TaxID=71784 RepID=A0A1Y2BHB8_9TREE|nr:hypothetical protein BCR39DRAFT_491169 [Naematelia encephala]
MRIIAIAALIAAPLISAVSQQPLQVYLHPSPSSPAHLTSAPTLSASQAKAVLAHHLGENIGDFEEIPQDESLWGHLVSMWSGNEDADRRARVVVIEGGVMSQDVIPTTLGQSPSFYLEEDSSSRALLAPYLQRASNFMHTLLKSLPSLSKSFKDTFELAGTKAAATLGRELSAFTALADSIPWLERLKDSHPWDAITISGLGHVDRHDEVWETGRAGVKAGLEAMSQPDSPPLLVIIIPSTSTRSSSHIVSRQIDDGDDGDDDDEDPVPGDEEPEEPQQPGDDDDDDDDEGEGDGDDEGSPEEPSGNGTLAQSCYTSNDSCSASTSCNGRGACALKLTTADGECWGCKCASGFAGVECQKEDYSVPFVILIFSTILLLGLLVGSVMLLMTVGDTKLPSTLTLAVGGHMKSS